MTFALGKHWCSLKAEGGFPLMIAARKSRHCPMKDPGYRLQLLALILLCSSVAVAQVTEGELRIAVRDSDGLGVAFAEVALVGRSPLFEAQAQADLEGRARLLRVPPGAYRLTVRQSGFAEFSTTVEVRSPVPRDIGITLEVAGTTTAITVTDTVPLLDVMQPAPVMRVSRTQLEDIAGNTLGRSAVDVVTTLPGWLLEANGVLHPRGSEYDTQYVVDGMPVYDNRSIGFAPAFEIADIEAVNVMTSGIPAEYGRRLGGVIAVDTRRVGTRGHGVEFDSQFGSFNNRSGSMRYQFRTDATSISLGSHAGYTERYLDPPSIENFTNKATAAGINFRLDHDLTSQDRIAFSVRTNESRFLVPNDLVQQDRGQRQDRFSGETSMQVHYQRVISAKILGGVRFMHRDLTAELWSNPQSTPVRVEQDRGFRESTLIADLSVEGERHTLKFGGDLRVNGVREVFRFGETAAYPAFDLDFRDERQSNQFSFFVQDHLRLGNFAANIGLRYDHYDFLIEDDALSPRIALSYWIPAANLQLRAAYDRIFQPPPAENLLLSSGAADLGVDAIEKSVPVPASRGNFFELGLSKPFLDTFRLDVSHYWRRFRNYMDDDVFLNTGLSFPISFDTARITGTEVRIDLPGWDWLSSSLSYSNMIGYATSPVTGGLFIEGSEADELRVPGERFSISQDQRNTLSGLVRLQPDARVWFASGIHYGSGLPVEFEDDNDDAGDDNPEAIPREIIERVNFERSRLRSVFSLDLSVGLGLWSDQVRSVTMQFDLRNATDHLNVINFSGVFSGTALGPGRQFTVQTKLRF